MAARLTDSSAVSARGVARASTHRASLRPRLLARASFTATRCPTVSERSIRRAASATASATAGCRERARSTTVSLIEVTPRPLIIMISRASAVECVRTPALTRDVACRSPRTWTCVGSAKTGRPQRAAADSCDDTAPGRTSVWACTLARYRSHAGKRCHAAAGAKTPASTLTSSPRATRRSGWGVDRPGISSTGAGRHSGGAFIGPACSPAGPDRHPIPISPVTSASTPRVEEPVAPSAPSSAVAWPLARPSGDTPPSRRDSASLRRVGAGKQSRGGGRGAACQEPGGAKTPGHQAAARGYPTKAMTSIVTCAITSGITRPQRW